MSNEPLDVESGEVAGERRRELGLMDSVSLVVGTIIGAGIFENAPLVARLAGGTWPLILVWLVGGLLALGGAMCFAELASRFADRVGGDYWYLRGVFGRGTAFLFAWASFWFIRPGNIGLMALTFGRYAHDLFPLGNSGLGFSRLVYAISAVTLLSAINLVGLKSGSRTQNLLSMTKVLGIAAVIGLGFLLPTPESSDEPMGARQELASFAAWMALMQSLVLVMFAFGGWNDLAFVAGEIKRPERNLSRALLMGTSLVVVIYLALNGAFLRQLGYQGLVDSQSIGADLIESCLGPTGAFGWTAGRLFSGLVCVACLGSVNALLITSPRIYTAVGSDFDSLHWVDAWNRVRRVPWRSVLFQLLVTVGLLALASRDAEPFNALVNATSPVFWSFLGMTFWALATIRRGQTDYRGYRAPGGNGLPLLMASVCFAMSAASLHYLWTEQRVDFAAVVGLVLLGGAGVYAWLRRMEGKALPKRPSR